MERIGWIALVILGVLMLLFTRSPEYLIFERMGIAFAIVGIFKLLTKRKCR